MWAKARSKWESWYVPGLWPQKSRSLVRKNISRFAASPMLRLDARRDVPLKRGYQPRGGNVTLGKLSFQLSARGVYLKLRVILDCQRRRRLGDFRNSASLVSSYLYPQDAG